MFSVTRLLPNSAFSSFQRFWGSTLTINELNPLAPSSTTVSYTHLDVYKRQEYLLVYLLAHAYVVGVVAVGELETLLAVFALAAPTLFAIGSVAVLDLSLIHI